MEYNIKVGPREILGKQVKNLRKQNQVPAAIYGFKGNFNVQVDGAEFTKLYANAGHTALVSIELDGKKHNCYIEEAQINPATREFIHISFKEVNTNIETTAEIPFELVNADESPAVKDQDSLVILSENSVLLRGLPKDLPQSIVIDVKDFNAGDTITLEQIKLPEGVSFVHGEEEDLKKAVVITTSAIQAEIVTEAPAEETTEEGATETAEENKEESKEE